MKSLSRLKLQKKMSLAKRNYEKNKQKMANRLPHHPPKQQFSTARPIKQPKITRKVPEMTTESTRRRNQSPYR